MEKGRIEKLKGIESHALYSIHIDVKVAFRMNF
jgi:hypothetical protein